MNSRIRQKHSFFGSGRVWQPLSRLLVSSKNAKKSHKNSENFSKELDFIETSQKIVLVFIPCKTNTESNVLGVKSAEL